MTDYKHFRIIVDLSAYFYDHRRVARVFVKNKLKNISDLQNRISEIFQINDFYLTTGGQFLPVSEDIRVLSNNESICVIPNKPQETVDQSCSNVSLKHYKKNKKHKRPLELISEFADETSSPRKKKSKKKHVDVTNFSNISSEDNVPCKKKKSENTVLVSDQSCTTELNQKKVIENGKSPGTKHVNSDNEVLQNTRKKQSIVEREICSIESSQKIIDIKKKLKQKADEFINKHSKETPHNIVDASNIKNVLPKLQSHIKNCNDLGRSTLPDTVRLSRHVDTPIKTFRYIPPPRITDKYLAKNRINIVKVEIVKKGNKDLIEHANTSPSSTSSDNAAGASKENTVNVNFSFSSEESNSPPKNYVKEVINTFEKNISPELKKDIGEQDKNKMDEVGLHIKDSEASNYTKAFLDQEVPFPADNLQFKADVAVNLTKTLLDISSVPNVILNRPENHDTLSPVLKPEAPSIIKPLNEPMESAYMFLDIPTDQDTSYYSGGTSKEFSLNSTNTSLNNSMNRSRNKTTVQKFGGVGLLLERLRESDSLVSHESDTSGQYVTDRKRFRKHRRKSKKSAELQKSLAEKVEIPVVKPMNVKACPKIHIKFEENEKGILEDKSLRMSDMNDEAIAENSTVNKTEELQNGDKPEPSNIKENKSVLMDTMSLSDENDDLIMENKSIFGDESISKAPLMTNKLEPKVGDVIAFKVMKLTKDYTPQISNYVVGKLEIYSLENKTVNFKILRGEEELLQPSGKLTLQEDVVLKNKYEQFLWTDLIEPKLLYP